MPSYLRPVASSAITCSFRCHTDRASVNPGVDYGVPTGTAVIAPAAGVIANAQWSSQVGWWLGVDFDDGWGADLLHNSSLLVSAGARVAAGQIIAYSGGTGSVATGPHLHWSLRNRRGSHLNNAGNVDGELYIGAPPPPPRIGRSTMNGAWRTPAGSIWLQFEPGCPLYAITGIDEWAGYSAAGNVKWADVSDSSMESLTARFGQSKDWHVLAPSTIPPSSAPPPDPTPPADTSMTLIIGAIIGAIATVILSIAAVGLLIAYLLTLNPDLIDGATALGGGSAATALLTLIAALYARAHRRRHGRRLEED